MPTSDTKHKISQDCGGGEPVVAPGYQASLLSGPPSARVRWRVVRRDGTRFRPVSELGVVIAQVLALTHADGCAWVVGSDEHTIEVRTHPVERSGRQVEVLGVGPRWTRTVQAAVTR
jgi:hypothetical protein